MAASPSSFTYIYYFVPYDGDVEEHPNAFIVKKPLKSITLADVTQAFPLPGTYFYRAKQPYGKTHVWLDLNSGEDAVPSLNGKITLKVSRLSNGASAPPVAAVAKVATPSTTGPSTAPASTASQTHRTAASAHAPAPKKTAETADMLGLFDSSSPSSAGPAHIAANSNLPADIFALGSAVPSGSPTGAGTMPPSGSSSSFDSFAPAGWGGSPVPAAASPSVVNPSQRPPVRTGPIAGPLNGSAPAAARPKPASSSILDGDIFNM